MTRARRGRRGLAALVLGLVLAGIATWAVRGVGYWLIVEDPLAPAEAVVVLGGDFPYRAIEAAAIYREQWAPEVWLTRGAAPAKEAVLARLGLDPEGEDSGNRRVLVRLGVPAVAIRLLDGGVQNTAEELDRVARELRRTGGARAIVVTSKAHSRRVRAAWRAVVGASPQAVVRHARDDPFEAGRWWRTTGDALAVARELLGLLNLWAGFPVKPAGGFTGG